MASPAAFLSLAQSTVDDHELHPAIYEAYTKTGKNSLEELILDCLSGQTDVEINPDHCDIVSDFFTIFG